MGNLHSCNPFFFQDDQTPLIVGSHSLITLAQPNRAITSLLRALFPHSVADVPPQHLQQWWDLLGHSAGSSHPPFFFGAVCAGNRGFMISVGEVSRSAPWDSTDFDDMPWSQLHFDHSERRDSTPGQTVAGKPLLQMVVAKNNGIPFAKFRSFSVIWYPLPR